MQFFDIVLMALIVIFVVLRLRSALGRRDGFGGDQNGAPDKRFQKNVSKKSKTDNVVNMPSARIAAPNDDEDFVSSSQTKSELESEREDTQFDGPLGEGVAAIREADATFRADEFMDGASYAFEMILNAYAAGDKKTLKPLLSSDVYGGFAAAIDERDARGQTLQETLVGIKKAELVEAYMDSRDAHVTVKFVSEQISALLDEDGTVIEGDPVKVIVATDFWTFSRSTKSRNPNWMLVGTGTLD